MGVTYGVLFCCWALVLWYGGVLVCNGEANCGKALSTVITVIIGGISLGQTMPNITAFAKAKAGAYNIFSMIERRPTINMDKPDAKELSSVQGHLEFRNMRFTYPSRPDVVIFENFSIDIAASKTVAIVGGSGSGKSTVVSLIERFYDPLGGEILLDGANIKTLNLKWLRGQIGLANQEPALFVTSLGLGGFGFRVKSSLYQLSVERRHNLAMELLKQVKTTGWKEISCDAHFFYPFISIATPHAVEQVNIGIGPEGSKVSWFRSSSNESGFINTVTFDEPDAPTIVLVHGYGAFQGFFFGNFNALASKFLVIAIDEIGWGASSLPDFTCTQEAESWFIDSLEEWRKAKNLDDFILPGHSLGGYVATRIRSM